MSEKVQVAAKKPEAKRENKVSKIQKADLSQSISSPVDRILFLQRTIGNQAVGKLLKSGTLQAKLRMGQPGDIYEQEADRVAEQVMRMPEPQVSRDNPAHPIQHKCPECNKRTEIEKEDEKLQKKEASGSTHEATPELESSISAVRGGGQPLPESVRAFYEPRFGRDFSQVRVHTDAKAAEAAGAVGARAFTTGQNIAFGYGQYVPETTTGKNLLAHELTHVLQQAGWIRSLLINNNYFHRKENIFSPGQSADMLQAEAKEDALKIKKIFQDNFVLGPFNQRDVMKVIEKWAKKPIETGSRLTSFDYFIVALRTTTFTVGVVAKQFTSAFTQLFYRMNSERIELFKSWMQNRARIFKEEKPTKMVSLGEEFEGGKWKKTAEEFWSAKFKNMGEFLNRIGTPTIIQNLLGGLVGVVEGFARLLIELVESIWSLAVAVDNLLGALLYFITGALEGGGLGFLKKIPLVGNVFETEMYKKKYEATMAFFDGAKEALRNPDRIFQGIKGAAIKAWEEVWDEYNKADEFNKSRIIAKGVVKVGMAVGGFIKNLPSLLKNAAKIAKTMEKGVVKVGKTIGKVVVKARKIIDNALQGAIKLGGKIFKGAWRVIEETIEGGKKKLRYFFKKTRSDVFEEVSEDVAKTCLDCNSPCKKTQFAKIIEELGEGPESRTMQVRTGRSEKARHRDLYIGSAGHHSFPQYLGGKYRQKLLDLPKIIHYLYHEELDKIVKVSRDLGSAYFRKLSKSEMQEILKKVIEHAKDFDGRYGNGKKYSGSILKALREGIKDAQPLAGRK